ncbi:ZIP-like iron-zinc transporter [Thelephora ganbajun]|uniref:ZIP-like iron-zinc transporter n=1 Tax=Thelephora ganbajun TaxID=370292 RepID=A0ACB6Z3J9_THEGA|nr:ZIP-like iron-zinc transporter [Thelephora ganbajun]
MRDGAGGNECATATPSNTSLTMTFSVPGRRFQRTLLLLSIVACVQIYSVLAKSTVLGDKPIYGTEIQECSTVQKLSKIKVELEEGESPLLRQIFAVLFPFGPGWNSVLGTFYISSVPNFILAFIPAQINADTLNTMTAFATGGLLSDVFLHLVPHSFLGEHHDVHFLMVEDKRNIIIGLGIFVGFASFFMMEKTLRVLGSEGEGHSHSHSHSHTIEGSTGHSSGVELSHSNGELKARKERKEDKREDAQDEERSSQNGPSKLSAYLNLFGDFVHNITDGLAMAASFYSSPLIGATTTLACFAHEIPHEIADYSILIRSGFTKRQAMQSQFITAIGAFIGTFMGIAIHNLSASGEGVTERSDLVAALKGTAAGILGTTVQMADLVIPFVAGGFLYIGAVAVLPTLLEESRSGKQALREFAAMAFGVACMFLVAWNE